MKILLSILLFTVLTGCADVVNYEIFFNPHVYGFWGGLWHGIVLPFSWISSLIFDDIAVYAVSNNGGWYDFGFMIGVYLVYRTSS